MLSLRKILFFACLALALTIAPAVAQMQRDPWDAAGGPGSENRSPMSQMATGEITGSVRTLNNNPVPNARIQVSSLLRGRIVAMQFTSQDGSFTVSNLPAGAYEVNAQSGTLQAGQRVQVQAGETWLTVRLPKRDPAAGDAGGPAVSVQQLRVPEKAASLLQKAQNAMLKNKLDEAANYVGKALAAYPEYAQALAMRGVLELQQRQLDRAAADANHAIQADPNNGTGYLVMGATLNAQQKFQQALLPLQRAETLLPNAWQGYFESSKALLELGKFESALQQVNRAFTLGDATHYPDLHLVKGYAYVGLRIYGSALTELQEYISQVPTGARADAVRATLAKIRPVAAHPDH